jgi:hypothetical protein
MTALRAVSWLLILGSLSGCQGPGYERIPATAVNNPDPLLGSTLRVKNDPAPTPDSTAAAPAKTEAPVTPTSQRPNDTNRIGPLTFRPSTPAPPVKHPADAFQPGTASLTLGVKEPKPETPAESPIRPVANVAPASDPEIVRGYRQRLIALRASSPKTRLLENGVWQAVAHFDVDDKTGQVRRVEAHGVTEADALLAILEQVERNK